MTIPNNHPYWLIRKIAESNLDINCFEISRYKYIPNSIEDKRTILKVKPEHLLDETFMADLLKKISEDENIAFHSEVTMKNNEKKHIPLIDMNTPSEAILEKLQNYLGENLYKKISWYKSGRSFHGYMEDMVEFKEWTQIMGRLLLCNQKNMAQTVDPRWIGHRLLAGYAALRWTKNGLHYIALPEKI